MGILAFAPHSLASQPRILQPKSIGGGLPQRRWAAPPQTGPVADCPVLADNKSEQPMSARAEDGGMDPPNLPASARDALTPRRRASIRRLIASGIGILALMAASDLLIANHDGRLALFRGGLIAVMFGLCWLTRNVRTSAAL